MLLSNRKWYVALGLTLISSGAFVTGAASAATPDPDSVSVVLQFSSDELALPGGPERLYARIQRVAHAICGTPEVRDLQLVFKAERCYDAAVNNAVAKIGASSLTALHRSQTRATSGA